MKGYKILDSSAIFSIIYEANFPTIFNKMIEEGYHVLIPKEVYREIKDIKIIAELLKDGKIDLLPECEKLEIDSICSRYPQFHQGEVSVLITGNVKKKNKEKYRCIIDEKDAKDYAVKNEINVNGVIGLFLWLKKIGRINNNECKQIYGGLSINPRLPKALLEELIK